MFPRLLLFQPMKVLVEIFLPSGGVRHKVVILVEKHHWLFSYTEEYYLLFANAQQEMCHIYRYIHLTIIVALY